MGQIPLGKEEFQSMKSSPRQARLMDRKIKALLPDASARGSAKFSQHVFAADIDSARTHSHAARARDHVP
jgi:hypothetical protein